MAQIRHIAIASDHPGKTADFYKKAFGFREVARHGFDPKNPDVAPRPCAVILTDGYISLALLKLAQDQTGVGLDYLGLHHFGVYVDDLEGTADKCLAQGCVAYDELPEEPGEKAKNYRPKRSDKFKGPENALFDIADHPWIGTAPAGK